MKINKIAHTPNTKKGVPDHYGSGIRNPIGKMIHTYMDSSMKKKDVGKPPKSLA